MRHSDYRDAVRSDTSVRIAAFVLIFAVATAGGMAGPSTAGGDGPCAGVLAAAEQGAPESSPPPTQRGPALRDLWHDPMIKNFIGLAENAWDFTAPEIVPGFGWIDEPGKRETRSP